MQQRVRAESSRLLQFSIVVYTKTVRCVRRICIFFNCMQWAYRPYLALNLAFTSAISTSPKTCIGVHVTKCEFCMSCCSTTYSDVKIPSQHEWCMLHTYKSTVWEAMHSINQYPTDDGTDELSVKS